MYCAIIGDIINSKELIKDKRREIQKELSEILKIINYEYINVIASKFLITIGDEFQGLLSSPDHIIKIVDMIQFAVHPVKIRFGVGIGDIVTDINKEMSIGADGPAYHNARKMIDNLKLIKNGKMSGSSNILIYSNEIDDVKLLDLLNINLQLCSFIESKWTEKQRQLIKMIYMEQRNQLEAAAELKIAQSSVQRRLKSAGYYDFLNARNLVSKCLGILWGNVK